MAAERVNILGVGVSSGLREQVIEKACGWLGEKSKGKLRWIATPNPEQVVQAREDRKFGKILNQADLAVADGVGMVLAWKWLSRREKKPGVVTRPVLERISGIELAEALIEYSRKNGLRVLIVGGKRGVARKASDELKRFVGKNREDSGWFLGRRKLAGGNRVGKQERVSLPKLRIKGIEGAVDVASETKEEREQVLKEIEEFKPALLLVAYGAPWQERWVWENRHELEKAGVRVVMVVGGAVDVWAGRVKRAPKMIRSLGFEWLWRLLIQPWRWKRQLRLIKFVRLLADEV